MDRTSRGTGTHHHGGQVLEHGATGAHHRSLADGDAGCDEYVGGHPGLVLDHDRKGLNVEARASVVVSAGAQIAVLRDDDIPADGDLRETVEHRMVAHPGVVPYPHFPGVGDGD